MLPEIFDKYGLVRYLGIDRVRLDRMNDDEIAREFTRAGFIYDTERQESDIALPLYWVGMQSAYRANWEYHRWATLFARVLVILRKKKQYETELQVLDAIIPRFPDLANYHEWQKRREKLKKIMNRKSTINGFLNWFMSVLP